jgi:protein subunit release factor B
MAYISKSKREQLAVRMQELGIREDDLIEKFILGSGKGGQKVNKTSSCVYLRHVPTKTEIKCQRERSRALNRHLARRELCDQLDELKNKKESARKQKEEKIRRQKRRRSRRQKQRMLDDKRKQAEKKVLRKKVDLENE